MNRTQARLRRLVRPPYGASLGTAVCAVLCVGGVAALHATRRDLDPMQHVLSEYANGPLGVVMTAVFYAAGVGCAALGWRLRTAVSWRGVTAAVPALLVAAGVGMVVAGLFEVGLPTAPETRAETVHSLASIGAFVALITAMALFAWACGHDPDWAGFRPVATALASVAVITAVISPLADRTPWTGTAQRVLAGAVVLWLLLTALRVRAVAFAGRVGEDGDATRDEVPRRQRRRRPPSRYTIGPRPR
ncbi:MAG TPA: DUF998 domain-containing protein [Euzebyales bacterium]|nr:DUF998 domain-containing protein [Euzebyales bacterium]